MESLTVLRLDDVYTPCVYFCEEVMNVRSLHPPICSCEAGKLGDVKRVPSMQWVLLNNIPNNVHLVRRRELFAGDNNFCLRMRAKGRTYVAWPDRFLYFGMSDAS